MIDTLSLVKYGLAALSVFPAGNRCGHIREASTGGELELPMALTLCGIVAAVVAWRLHRRGGEPKK